MRLYKITHGEQVLAWAGTQADAKDKTREWSKTRHGETIDWSEVDVPTDKAGLIEFLNSNAVSQEPRE
jgi:hypothetical protein